MFDTGIDISIQDANPEDKYENDVVITATIPSEDSVVGVENSAFVDVTTRTKSPEYAFVEINPADLGLPEEYVELSYTTHNAPRGAKEITEALQHIEQYGSAHVDVDARGNRAVELVQKAPGVVEAYYNEYVPEVVVKHDVARTDTYDTLKMFAGLEERHWWIDFSREHGMTLSIEYGVNQFAINPTEEDWENLEQKLEEKTRESELLLEDEFHRSLIHRDEYNGNDRQVTTHHELNGDVDYHRLAGTDNSAEHAYYMVELRNGDPEVLADEVFHDLEPEDIVYLAEWAVENLSEEHLEEYALNSYCMLERDRDSFTIDDIDDYVPRDEREYGIVDSSSFFELDDTGED